MFFDKHSYQGHHIPRCLVPNQATLPGLFSCSPTNFCVHLALPISTSPASGASAAEFPRQYPPITEVYSLGVINEPRS